MSDITLLQGDAFSVLRTMDAGTFDCAITSPPYWSLLDYEHEEQIGLEGTPSEYVAKLVRVSSEVYRCLKPNGTLWLNIGDTYASAWSVRRRNRVGAQSLPDGTRKQRPNRLVEGLKEGDLAGIPWRVALALQEAGWLLRSSVIWHKENPTPEGSVRDRPRQAHEYIFMLTKQRRYQYDDQGLSNVWTMATSRGFGGHPATFPEALVERCLFASCPAGGSVLDPFCGSGTVAAVATRNGRLFTGIDIRQDYLDATRIRCGLCI